MRALITTAAAAAILATSTLAFAAQTANGTVKSFDQKADPVTLTDGANQPGCRRAFPILP
ncbi:MAG: hypothetical protein R3D29_11005 [Nitratireductor sp.]